MDSSGAGLCVLRLVLVQIVFTLAQTLEVPADWKLANIIPTYKGCVKTQETTDLLV